MWYSIQKLMPNPQKSQYSQTATFTCDKTKVHNHLFITNAALASCWKPFFNICVTQCWWEKKLSERFKMEHCLGVWLCDYMTLWLCDYVTMWYVAMLVDSWTNHLPQPPPPPHPFPPLPEANGTRLCLWARSPFWKVCKHCAKITTNLNPNSSSTRFFYIFFRNIPNINTISCF